MPRPRPEELRDEIARLPEAFWQSQRWYGAKGRALAGVRVIAWGRLDTELAIAAIAELGYAEGPPERYFVLLAMQSEDLAITDGLACEEVRQALLVMLARGSVLSLDHGEIVFRPEPKLCALASRPLAGRLLAAEQSNSALIYDDQVFLKIYRRVVEGQNPDIEVSRFLTVRAGFRRSPTMLGSIVYRDPAGCEHALGLAQAFVKTRGNAWEILSRDDPRGASERARSLPHELGELTAELHLALASQKDEPDFTPRPIDPHTVGEWRDAIARSAARARAELLARGEDPSLAWETIPERLAALDELGSAGVVMTRVHGDYHLGQVLVTDDGLLVTDFEGEPLRSLAERRALHTPLKDVAGMLRSLDYAAHARGADEAWLDEARRAFLRSYLTKTAGAPFLPKAEEITTRALAVLELEKLLYELSYELGNRPDWAGIPLMGLRRLLVRQVSKRSSNQ